MNIAHQFAGMSNAGIVALCKMLTAPAATITLQVVRLGPPSDNGGELSQHALQAGIVPLLSKARRIEVGQSLYLKHKCQIIIIVIIIVVII